MEFKREQLEREGFSCDFQFNQEIEKMGGTADLIAGTYTFPDDLSLRQLVALFQKGFPIPQARSNLAILFFLSHVDFFRLPKQREINLIRKLMQNPKGHDLYVDFNEFSRVIKYTDMEQLDRAYRSLTETVGDRSELWDAVCRSGWDALDKALFAYKFLQG